MSTVFCPASMCPLIAPDGSPWTGSKDSICPEHDDIEKGGCPWFSMACGSGGVHDQVCEAFKNNGKVLVAGPNKPKEILGNQKTYNCKRENDCSWQKFSANKGLKLCPPRYALSLGLDPRVSLF